MWMHIAWGIAAVVYLSIGLVYAFVEAEKDDSGGAILLWTATWPLWAWIEFIFWLSIRIRKRRRRT